HAHTVLNRSKWRRLTAQACFFIGKSRSVGYPVSESDLVMRTTCLICRHEKREKIDVELLSGKSTREVARRFELSRSSLERHTRKHLKPGSQAMIPANPDSAEASHERAKASHILSNQPHPWERQPRESIPAWRAFETFLQLSVANPHREVSYGEVSAAVAKNKS